MTAGQDPGAAQRIDKWLWCARLFKTRTLAAKVVADRSVRLTRGGMTIRIEKPSALIRPGDHIAFLSGESLRVLEVLACAERRGPAPEAQSLYTDRSPPRPARPDPAPFARERGSGRPTKKHRRELDRLASTTGGGRDDAL